MSPAPPWVGYRHVASARFDPVPRALLDSEGLLEFLHVSSERVGAVIEMLLGEHGGGKAQCQVFPGAVPPGRCVAGAGAAGRVVRAGRFARRGRAPVPEGVLGLSAGSGTRLRPGLLAGLGWVANHACTVANYANVAHGHLITGAQAWQELRWLEQAGLVEKRVDRITGAFVFTATEAGRAAVEGAGS